MNNTDVLRARQFVEAVDALIELRQQELKEGKRTKDLWRFPGDVWEIRNYTSTQIRQKIYGTFADLKGEKIRKLPSRDMIMQIADYLDCTIEQRNKLLSICEYVQVPIRETGERLEVALSVAEEVLKESAYPGYVINRDWDIHIINAGLLQFIGMSPEMFKAIDLKRRNVLQIIFDPDLGVRHGLEVSEADWLYIARRNIYGFKYVNQFSQREPWFQERVERWHTLPDFEQLWRETNLDTPISYDDDGTPFAFYKTTMQTPKGIIRFRSVLSSLGNYDYPQVVTYQPVDTQSKLVYLELGIGLPVPTPVYR